HSVVVRINDRGPFVAGRIIDLSKAAAEALDLIPVGVTDVRLSVISKIGDLKSGPRGWIDKEGLAPTIRTASVDPESKPIRRSSQAAKVDPESKSAKHKEQAVTKIGAPATSSIRTASVDPESKAIRRNSQAAKVDPESKSAKHKKRVVTEIGTAATSTIRTALVDPESKPIRRNSQAAKVDPESKAQHKKRAVSEIGTPATSAPAPVAKPQPPGGIKRADGRARGFLGFLKSAFGNP